MDPRLLCEALASRFPSAVIAWHTWRGDATVTIRREALLEVALALKEDPQFAMNFLMDLTAVDTLTLDKPAQGAAFNPAGVPLGPPPQIPAEEPWPGPATLRPGSGEAPARFELVIHFLSTTHKHRVRIKVPVEESDPVVDSLTGLWPAADWYEREVWDMYGIRFRGHPNLKRILMYGEFVGYPLRKDYPVNKRQPLIGPVN